MSTSSAQSPPGPANGPKPPRKPRASTATYRRLARYVAPFRLRVAGAVTLSAVAAAAAAGYAFVIGPLLRAVLMGQGSLQVAGGDVDVSGWRGALPAAIVALAAVKATTHYLGAGLMTSVGQSVMTHLRRALYGKLLALPPGYFEKRHSGAVLSHLTSDIAQVEFSVSQALSSYAKDALHVLALCLFCAWLDGRLFLLLFVVLPAAAIPVSRFARSVKKVATRTQASLARLTELLSEQLQGLSAVQAYRAEQSALARFDAEQQLYQSAMMRSLFIRGAFTPTLELLGIAGVALALSVGAQQVALEPALATKLISFLTAALLMYQPLKSISGTFSQVATGVAAAERLFELIDEPLPPERGQPARPLQRSLRFDRVRFSYDGQREALAGLTFDLAAGQRVALVGPSGSGKSTTFAALLGFVEPTGGGIWWDGVSLEALTRSSLRAQMAWVPQEPVLFSGSVRENLLLGAPDASEEALWTALRQAHAEAFVRQLPHGIDEQVGERGARLSGGQRQRLAIARAFLRRPSLLLLDEPTSALDAASEQDVQAGLDELMRDRTTLVIAHRLATVRACDLILVLDGGAVVEAGTHAQLLSRGGLYARLSAQLEGPVGRVEAAPAVAG